MSEPTLISFDCWIADGSFFPRSVRPPPPDCAPSPPPLPPQAASSSARLAAMASSKLRPRLIPTMLLPPSQVAGTRLATAFPASAGDASHCTSRPQAALQLVHRPCPASAPHAAAEIG